MNKLLHSSLSWLKAIVTKTVKFSAVIIGYISIEICFWLATLGIGYLFVSWGVSYSLANYAALALAIAVLISAVSFKVWQKSKKHPKNYSKSKVRLANWIANYFADRTSPEWTEYQDWLHDILLARRQLLDAKSPRWKVFLITYWRLSGFLVIVSLAKMKNAVVTVMRLR